ncbi:MAG TPA: hypothetical protein VK694_03315 [Verrucomicrobiae bacterium]|nr:hypothetical protein [Verrucomicrobiae bacterium]
MSFQQQPVDPAEISREQFGPRTGAEIVGAARVAHLDETRRRSAAAFEKMGIVVDMETYRQNRTDQPQTPEVPQQAMYVDERVAAPAPVIDLDAQRSLRAANDAAVPTAEYEDYHDLQTG